jgi:hypothetical protein
VGLDEAPDEWVVAWNSSWLHDALFVRSLLESEGIDVQVPDEHTVGVHSLLANAIGGIRVLVRSGDRERAAEILSQLTERDPPAT